MALTSDVSLRQLRYFAAAAELGQFSQAARRLHVSQSVVTTAIGRLEKQMGVALFDRLPHGVVLTADGHRFHQHVRHILDTLNDALTEPPELADDVAGTVRLGASYIVLGYFLPGLLARFKRNYPRVEIALVDMERARIEEGVAAGELDLGLCIVSNADPDLPLAREVLLRSRRQMWLSEQHPLMACEQVHLRDVAGHPYIMLSMDEGEASAARFWGAAGLAPQVAFRTSSMEGLRGLVAYGFGVTILSDMVYRPWSLDGRKIHARPLVDAVPDMEVGMLYRSEATLQPAAKALRRFVLMACSD